MISFRLADEKQLAELNKWIGAKSCKPEEKIAAVTAIYNEIGLKKLSEDKMQEYYNLAMNNLSALKVESSKLDVLKDVVSRLMFRKS